MTYDDFPTDPRHGGKMTPEQMAARIAELEGDLQVSRLQLSARLCSECPARERVAKLASALRNLVMLERTKTPDMGGKRRRYAFMQNGTVLADCLDEARHLLDGETAGSHDEAKRGAPCAT